jgi:hypothetical protein
MWRGELYIAFRKGEHFANACDQCAVPCDCLDEAADIWGNARAAAQFDERGMPDRYWRAAA